VADETGNDDGEGDDDGINPKKKFPKLLGFFSVSFDHQDDTGCFFVDSLTSVVGCTVPGMIRTVVLCSTR
jgi:hypothetical protein